MRAPFALFLTLSLTACTQFPELDARQTPGIDRAPYPALLPLDPLLVGPETRIADGDAQALAARADRLAARADRLRQTSPSPDTGAEDASDLRERADALRQTR